MHLVLRSDDGVEVGILGGDIVVRRAGWLARRLLESCPAWLGEVLLVAKRRLPMAVTTACDSVQPSLPPAASSSAKLQRGDRLRNRGGQGGIARDTAYLHAEAGEHRVALVAGAQVLIERERFRDSYRLVPGY